MRRIDGNVISNSLRKWKMASTRFLLLPLQVLDNPPEPPSFSSWRVNPPTTMYFQENYEVSGQRIGVRRSRQ
jgi:hypothetical protein